MSSFKTAPAPSDGAIGGEIGQLESDPMFSQIEKALLLLSPIFAPIVGWFTAWVGTHFPGVDVSKSKATDLFIAGVALVVLLVLKYVHSKDSRLGVSSGLAAAGHFVQGEVAQLPDGLVYEKDLENLLQSHKDQISKQLALYEQDVEGKLPKNVAEALANVLQRVNLGDLLSGKVDTSALVAHVQAPPGTEVSMGSGAVGGAAGQTAS